MTVSNNSHQGEKQEEGKGGGGRGKIEWKLSEVNTRAVSREENGLIGEFKMVIRIRGQVMKYAYISTGTRKELVKFGVDCNQMGLLQDSLSGHGGH